MLSSLISAFIIPLLESIICILAARDISNFYLVSVAEQASLNLNLSETSDMFSHATARIMLCMLYIYRASHWWRSGRKSLPQREMLQMRISGKSCKNTGRRLIRKLWRIG